MIGAAQTGEKFEPAAAAQIDVEHDDGRLLAHVSVETLFGSARFGDDAVGQKREEAAYALADDIVVVDNQKLHCQLSLIAVFELRVRRALRRRRDL